MTPYEAAQDKYDRETDPKYEAEDLDYDEDIWNYGPDYDLYDDWE
jgi:hypothetical protein